jgi:Tol biopolymer transport system component
MDSNPNEIWTANADDSRQSRLTIANFERGGVGVDSARWSPDGSLIAYATDCGTRYDTHCGVLRLMGSDGHDKRTVDMPVDPSNHEIGRDRFPTWSPDGTRIAFMEIRKQVIWVCIVSVANGKVRCLTRGGEAAWSPDGNQLVYVHAHDIWTIRADGAHRRNVTRTPNRWESNPDWQPR